MLKRSLIVVVILFAVLLSFQVTPPAHAMPYTSCGTSCQGNVDWNGGNNYGMLTKVYLPVYTGSSTNVLERFISVYDTQCTVQSLLKPCWINVGYCFGNNTSHNRPECTNNSGNWFETSCSNNGVISCEATIFGSINALDEGSTVVLGIRYDPNDLGFFPFGIVISNLLSSHDICPDDEEPTDQTSWTCSANRDFGAITDNAAWANAYEYNYTNGSFTGTRQGTFTWTLNQWISSDENRHWQTVDPTVNSVTGAQMLILTHPGPLNNGGTMEGCNKDNGLLTC